LPKLIRMKLLAQEIGCKLLAHPAYGNKRQHRKEQSQRELKHQAKGLPISALHSKHRLTPISLTESQPIFPPNLFELWVHQNHFHPVSVHLNHFYKLSKSTHFPPMSVHQNHEISRTLPKKVSMPIQKKEVLPLSHVWKHSKAQTKKTFAIEPG